MALLSPYVRLMRLHQPTGIWLLLWPCWWSLALAAHGLPTARLLLLFLVGAVLMRSAGCIINDIVDRKFDRQVERTKNRPLASGELSVPQALFLLALLLLGALDVAAHLGQQVLLWSLLSLVLVVIYPFMKRISWWPQFFLGLTFNWGALVGTIAIRGVLDWPSLLLYAGGVCWTLGYDTIYAHQDVRDDVKAGVKSSALALGERSKRGIGGFYLLAVIFWALTGLWSESGILFYTGLLIAELQLGWQICNVWLDDPASCLRMFKSNSALGWLMFGAILAGTL